MSRCDKSQKHMVSILSVLTSFTFLLCISMILSLQRMLYIGKVSKTIYSMFNFNISLVEIPSLTSSLCYK